MNLSHFDFLSLLSTHHEPTDPCFIPTLTAPLLIHPQRVGGNINTYEEVEVLKDVSSEHGLADLVFVPMRAATSDGADGIDDVSALGLPAPVTLSPCDTIKAAYDVISRRVAPEVLLADRRAGKLDFFF